MPRTTHHTLAELKDAPRAWSMEFTEELKEIHFIATVADPQIFVHFEDQRGMKKLVGILSAHVDDLKGGCRQDVRLELEAHLEKKFGKLKKAEKDFEHCGVKHVAKDGGYWLTQSHYVQQLRPLSDAEVASWKDDDERIVPAHLGSSFISLVCAMAWVLLTAPAISVYISYLQRWLKGPRARQVRQANRVLRYLQARPHGGSVHKAWKEDTYDSVQRQRAQRR